MFQTKVNHNASSISIFSRNITFKMMHMILFVIMLASTVENSIAQQEVQVCSCSPPEYRWRLNFSRGCPLEISPPKGTKDKYCDEVDKSQGFNGDVTPVRVTDITLIELDTDLIAIKNIQQTNTTLVNGDSITFESLSTVGVITGGFQGEFRAVNAAGQSFTLEFLVRFSNLCEVLPFSVGDSLGYLEFVSFYFFSSNRLY